MPKYSVETVYQIWNDDTGFRVEVGPDSDGLDLVEIKLITDDNQIGNSMIITIEQAKLLAPLILKCAEDLDLKRTNLNKG